MYFITDITKKVGMGGYTGQKEVKQNRIADLLDHRDIINLKARELENPLGVIDDVEVFTKRQSKAKEHVFRIKLNRTERERLIATIKARQSILEIGDTQQMGTSREEQINAAQQIRHEAKVITQNISTEMTSSPLMALVARILRKLPEKAYKYLSATVILSMALSACSAINRSKEFEAGQAESPVATAVMPDTVSDKEVVIEVAPSITPTETAEPIDPVEDLLSRYLVGEDIDASTLTQEEFIEFSAKLTDEKNEARGINPIIYNDEKYIDPSDYKLKEYDGHPDMNETIQMYVPIAGKDEQGNLQFMVNGQLVTIANSAGMDWNMQITSSSDTRINWPNTKPIKETGIPESQSIVDAFGIVLRPMVFLGKQMGEFYLDGAGGHAPLDESTLRFYDIETDATGNPILARMILTIGMNYNLFEEGGTLDTQSFSGPIKENSYFYQGLVENTVYHVGISPHVTQDYDHVGLSVDNYSGVISDDSVPEIISGTKINNNDMVLAQVNLLIIKR